MSIFEGIPVRSEQDFWRAIPARSHVFCKGVAGLEALRGAGQSERASETKVTEFQVTVRIKEYIAGLVIPEVSHQKTYCK